MKLISTTETAKIWGISANRITILAKEGRIPGAVQIGMRWMIPEKAQKPIDGRKKKAQTDKTSDFFFRFPLYVNFEEKDYLPPLSEEELILRRGQIAFHGCRFSEAKTLLLPLEKAENPYVRISAIYHRLSIAIYENSPDYDALLWKMNLELSRDFPYKKEMALIRYGFDADYVSYRSLLDNFAIDSGYAYHPTSYYVMALVSFIPIQNGEFSLMSKLRYDTQEVLCQLMEHEGHFLEAQKMHYLLVVCYHLQSNLDKMEAHIRNGLTIAMEHELYYVAAFYERLYRNPTRKVLSDFPENFSKKIQSLGRSIQKKQGIFEESHKIPSYMSLLSSREYEYAFLANQGYTNREIAGKLKISEKTVSKMFSRIYDKLAVKSKQEFVALINGTHKGL